MSHSLGYRRILVPIGDNPESEKAMDVACRLADEHGASLTLVAVVEIPPVLPLDAHMEDEQAAGQRLLDRARAIADSYGVGVTPQIVHARDAAQAIVEMANASQAELLIIGSPRKAATKGVTAFGSTVEHVLRRAPCRVMVIATMPAALAASRSAAA
jgi:nucleotide-binding universal stress UspA family protein